jgi:hypothetical protein
MASPFDSPIPILCRLSIEIFRLCLTVQKLFVCIYLASRSQNLGFSGVLTPKCNSVSTRPLKSTSLQQTASFEPTCMQFGRAVFAVEDYKKKVRYSTIAEYRILIACSVYCIDLSRGTPIERAAKAWVGSLEWGRRAALQNVRSIAGCNLLTSVEEGGENWESAYYLFLCPVFERLLQRVVTHMHCMKVNKIESCGAWQ